MTAEPEVRDARLALARRTGDALRTGLGLLGIETLERM
jgi:arginyl-tRNA synthetase